MKKFITRLLDRIEPNEINITCYQLEDLLSTALISHALENDIELKHRYKEGFISLKKEEFVKELDPNLKIIASGTNMSNIYMSDDTVFTISNEDYSDDGSKTDLLLLSQNKNIVDKFDELCSKYISETKANTVFALSQNMEGFYLASLGKLEAPLIRENYSDKVLDGFDFAIDDFQAKDPHGRLLIVNGPPGTGKTYLVKGLISELKSSTIIVIPPRMISEIDGPTLIPIFISHRRKNEASIVLIIEDADACLAPRQADNISAISSLLNCADGILGSLLDIRIIATTNQEKMEFDPALTRPGRLSRHIEVEDLSADEATQVYRRLSDDNSFSYSGPKTLASIYIEADLATGGKVKGSKKKNTPKQPPSNLARKRLGF